MVLNAQSRPSSSLRSTVWFTFLCAICLLAGSLGARSQTQPPTPQSLQAEGSQDKPKPGLETLGKEIVSSDASTTFKLRVNIVLVRVVARDKNGRVVTNLKKEDFQLTDDHKPQVISTFSVETPVSHVPVVAMETSEATSQGTPVPVKAPEFLQGFVALFFDDLQLSVADAVYSQQAARKVLGSLREADRFALFTTSGQVEQDFTADRTKLDEAIQRVTPTLQDPKEYYCHLPPSLYLANQVINLNDTEALAAAIEDCGSAFQAEAWARRIFSFGEYKVHREFASLGALVRRMSELPGQRTIVMVSPGFFVPSSIHESGDIIDRATKANIVISAIDARGLFTPYILPPEVAPAAPPPQPAPPRAHDDSTPIPDTPAKNPYLRQQYIKTGELMQDDVLGELADGTGGLFFHGRNDIEQGLQQAATEPEVSYVLGFAPEHLKLDGRYHQLRVSLVNKQNLTLRARHGYFAPHGESNPESNVEDVAQQEIAQAVFSQTEMQDFPVQSQAKFFSGADGVHLTVVARIETATLKFRKDQNHNDDNLTVVTAVFDENGNLLDGQWRVIEMTLRDATRERLNKEGLRVKFNFDLHSGSYLVRIVVRDSEGAQMAALNRAVVIP